MADLPNGTMAPPPPSCFLIPDLDILTLFYFFLSFLNLRVKSET